MADGATSVNYADSKGGICSKLCLQYVYMCVRAWVCMFLVKYSGMLLALENQCQVVGMCIGWDFEVKMGRM